MGDGCGGDLSLNTPPSSHYPHETQRHKLTEIHTQTQTHLKKEWFALEFWLCNALSQGWWIPVTIWCGAPSKFSVPHMVLAKPGCSLSAINPPVMCSLHLSASHHWANIKQVFSGECGGSESATPHYTKISSYIESSDIKELYFCQYGAWESTPHKQKLILPTKIHVDRQTWDLPCVDKHTKVSQESINPATTTLNNTISESGVQNCGVFQPKQIDSSFPEGEASTTRKEKVRHTS